MENRKYAMSNSVVRQHKDSNYLTLSKTSRGRLSSPTWSSSSTTNVPKSLPDHYQPKDEERPLFLNQSSFQTNDTVQMLVLDASDFTDIVTDEKTLKAMINAVIDNDSVQEIVVDENQIFQLEEFPKLPIELAKNRNRLAMKYTIVNKTPVGNIKQPIPPIDKESRLLQSTLSSVNNDTIGLKCEETIFKEDVSTIDPNEMDTNDVEQKVEETSAAASDRVEIVTQNSAVKGIVICRTCLKAVPSDTSTKLFDYGKNKKISFDLREKLFALVGFIDINATCNPVVCGECVEAIQIGFTFQKSVKSIEERISKLRKGVLPVDLKDVAEEMSKNYLSRDQSIRLVRKEASANLEKYLEKCRRIIDTCGTLTNDGGPSNPGSPRPTISDVPTSSRSTCADDQPTTAILKSILSSSSTDDNIIFEIVSDDEDVDDPKSLDSSPKVTVPSTESSAVQKGRPSSVPSYSAPKIKSPPTILGSTKPFVKSTVPSMGPASFVTSINSSVPSAAVQNRTSAVQFMDSSVPLLISTVPGLNSSVPGQNSALNGKATAQIMNSSIPIILSTVPDLNSAVPGLNSSVPGLNSSVLGLNSSFPSLNSATNGTSTAQIMNSSFQILLSTAPSQNSSVPGSISSVPGVNPASNGKSTVQIMNPSIPIILSTVPSVGPSVASRQSSVPTITFVGQNSNRSVPNGECTFQFVHSVPIIASTTASSVPILASPVPNQISKGKPPVPALASFARNSVPTKGSTVQSANYIGPISVCATPSVEPSAPVAAATVSRRNSSSNKRPIARILRFTVPDPECSVSNLKSVPDLKSVSDPVSSDPTLKSSEPDLKSSGPDPKSAGPDPKSSVPDTESSVPDPKSSISNVESSLPNVDASATDTHVPIEKSSVPVIEHSSLKVKLPAEDLESSVPIETSGDRDLEKQNSKPIILSNILLSDDSTPFDRAEENHVSLPELNPLTTVFLSSGSVSRSESKTEGTTKRKLSPQNYDASSLESFLVRRQERCKKFVPSPHCEILTATNTGQEQKKDGSVDSYGYLFNTHIIKKRKPLVPATSDLFDEQHDTYFRELDSEPGSFMVQKWKRLGQEDEIGDPPYLCADCGKVFMIWTKFKTHIVNHKVSDVTICPYCSIRITTKQLDRHVRLRHGPPRFECPDCNRKFHLKNYLQAHISKAHKNVNRRFQCQVCGLMLCRKSLAHHMVKHKNDGNFACDECQMVFHNRGSWNKHRRREHLGLADGYMCDICSKPVKTRRSLEKHKLSYHEGGKTKRCPICDKLLSMRQSLISHVKFQHAPKRHVKRKTVKQPKKQEETQSAAPEQGVAQEATNAITEQAETHQATEFISFDLEQDKLQTEDGPQGTLIYDSIIDAPAGVEEIEVPYNTISDVFLY